MSTKKAIEVGDLVCFIDPTGREFPGLVTAVWKGEYWEKNPDGEPGLNIVYVSPDENQTDTYGRQIRRDATSLVHVAMNPAGRNCWKRWV
jgi:hypothetical protein